MNFDSDRTESCGAPHWRMLLTAHDEPCVSGLRETDEEILGEEIGSERVEVVVSSRKEEFLSFEIRRSTHGCLTTLAGW